MYFCRTNNKQLHKNMMKVLLVSGSAVKNGNTFIALSEIAKTLEAEGIETEEQMKVMSELGIEYIQGYYFSRPVPEDEFIAFLKEKNPECQK